jgi:hypothetical protein
MPGGLMDHASVHCQWLERRCADCGRDFVPWEFGFHSPGDRGCPSGICLREQGAEPIPIQYKKLIGRSMKAIVYTRRIEPRCGQADHRDPSFVSQAALPFTIQPV